MGVNLCPGIPLESFRVIHNKVFRETEPHDEHDLEDNCVVAGVKYRLLKFDFLCFNLGDTDFVAGSPKSRPDLFTLSTGHGHYHLKDFNLYKLVDSSGKNAIPSLKQAFCIEDMIPPIDTDNPVGRFRRCTSETDIQGISAGWADVYRNTIACQYIILTGVLSRNGESQNIDVPDGEYILEAETNPVHEDGPFKGRRYFEEDNYKDNKMQVRLQVSSSEPYVTVIGGMLH
jgi:lysyl oxidase